MTESEKKRERKTENLLNLMFLFKWLFRSWIFVLFSFILYEKFKVNELQGKNVKKWGGNKQIPNKVV